MELVTIAPGHALAPAAAASYLRCRAAGMPAGITSSTRTAEEQAVLRARWLHYLAGTGPKVPYAKPVGESKHQTGEALDLPYRSATDAESWMRANPDHGWRFTDPNEQWHAEYFLALDDHLAVPPRPIEPIEPVQEEDDMGDTRVIYNPATQTTAVIGPVGSGERYVCRDQSQVDMARRLWGPPIVIEARYDWDNAYALPAVGMPQGRVAAP